MLEKVSKWNVNRIKKLYSQLWSESMLNVLLIVRDDRLYPVDASYQLQREDKYCFVCDYLSHVVHESLGKTSPGVHVYGSCSSWDYPCTVRNFLSMLGLDYDNELKKVATMLNDVKLTFNDDLCPSESQK